MESPALKKIVEKFTCENCEDYLRPPISICNGGTIICGSCSQLLGCKESIIGRCQPLENIGSLLKLPCRYSDFGCKIYLSWRDADLHEKQCLFKQYTCPVCISWKGNEEALKIHIEKVHENLINYDKCYLSLCKGIIFFYIAKELYVLLFESDKTENVLWFSLKAISSSSQAKRQYFKLTLYLPNSEDYSEMKQVESAGSWEMNKDTAIKIDLRVLKLRLQIKHEKWVKLKLNVFPRTPLFNGCADKDILKDVECVVCQDFMTAPIFQCIVGHSFCGLCRPKLSNCPICREKLSGSRNFALESICSKICFKCLYADNGCSFISKLDDIFSHENRCSFSFVECPLKNFIGGLCKWSGKLNEVKSHMSLHGIDL